MTQIVNAAIRYPGGAVYVGSRHADCIKKAADSGAHKRTDKFEQGFVVFEIYVGGFKQWFVTREEALKLAIEQGLVPKDHKQLYSEDLWPVICHRCHSHQGFFRKSVEVRTYYFNMDGSGDGEADDPRDITKGRPHYYCIDCNADLTKQLEKAGIL